MRSYITPSEESRDLIQVGQKVKVELPVKWIGACNTDANTVWLAAKITEVSNEIDVVTKLPKYVYVDVRASSKYKTIRIPRMMCIGEQVRDQMLIKK